MSPFISCNPEIAETEPPAPTFWVGVRDDNCYVAEPATRLTSMEVLEMVTEFLTEEDQATSFEFVIGAEG